MNLLAILDRIGSAPVIFGMVIGLGLAAVLLARFRPDRRPLLRRPFLLFALYASAAFVRTVVMTRLGPEVEVAVDLFQGWALVALFSVLLFELALPALRLPVVELTSDLLTGAAYLFVTVAVLSAAGLEFTSLLAASTVAGVVLTVSLQSTLGNIVGGLALQLEGSVRVGDWIRLENGREGRVRSVRWRHTTLETRDNDTLMVPNNLLLTNLFTLLGARDGRPAPHRQWVSFNIDFRQSPSHIVAVVQDALRASPIPGVAVSPEPDCICLDLARDGRDSYAVYAVRYFLVDLAIDAPTDSLVRARIRAALRRVGVSFARPSLTQFHVDENEATHVARDQRRHARALSTVAAVDLFRSLTDEERAQVAGRLIFCPFEAGETITHQGAVAHWLYLLAEGTAEIRTSVAGAPPTVVARVSAPGFFGEMGLMTGEPRLASVVAVTAVACYRLDKTAFQDVLTTRPALAAELSELLAARRMELLDIREGLDDLARTRRMESEKVRILERIRSFFGIGE